MTNSGPFRKNSTRQPSPYAATMFTTTRPSMATYAVMSVDVTPPLAASWPHARRPPIFSLAASSTTTSAEYYIFPISGDSQIEYAWTLFGTIRCTIRVHDTGARILCHDRNAISRIVSFFGITAKPNHHISMPLLLPIVQCLVALAAS